MHLMLDLRMFPERSTEENNTIYFIYITIYHPQPALLLAACFKASQELARVKCVLNKKTDALLYILVFRPSLIRVRNLPGRFQGNRVPLIVLSRKHLRD